MLTTVLDCLCPAEVLVNDNVARCNGLLMLFPAAADEEARVVITLTKRRE